MNAPDLEELQKRIGYFFNNPQLLSQALTHGSYLGERPGSGLKDNQQLEFLGDAVLELVVRDHLLKRFPDLSEGELSKRRAMLVSKRALGTVARALDLGSHLLLGKGEEMSRGRVKASILADAYEALVAAIYQDGGLEKALAALEAHFFPLVADIMETGQLEDYKTQLQELAQSRYKTVPVYHLGKEQGKKHERLFEVEVRLAGQLLGKGSGRTKKEAAQKAAREALEKLSGE